jgi:hypothetical protein
MQAVEDPRVDGRSQDSSLIQTPCLVSVIIASVIIIIMVQPGVSSGAFRARVITAPLKPAAVDSRDHPAKMA